MVQHVGAGFQAFLCGVCMFSPCSPGFPPIEPHNKNMPKKQIVLRSCPWPRQDWALALGPRAQHWWMPTAPGFPWGRPGWDKCREGIPPVTLRIACVSPLTVCVFEVCIPCGKRKDQCPLITYLLFCALESFACELYLHLQFIIIHVSCHVFSQGTFKYFVYFHVNTTNVNLTMTSYGVSLCNSYLIASCCKYASTS